MIVKRRRMDDEDDLATFLGSLPRTVTHDEDEAMEVDELGRERNPDPVLQRPERRAARTARHARRVQVAKGKALPRSVSMSTTTAASIEEEGYSSDGSLDSSDAQDLVFALASVAERATDVLSDVQAKDFRDPAVGVGRWFGEWRKRYEEIYVGAWGGLGAVGAWEFWVRWELMGGERRVKKKDDEGKDDGSRKEPWNPLEAGASTMDNMEWFGKLYAYSRPNTVRERIAEDDDDDEEGELGPEGDLAAAMVGTAVVPRVVTMLEAGAFDPYSARHVRKLVDFGEQVEIAVERSGPKFQVSLLHHSSSPNRLVVVFCSMRHND
jgi:GC-rich sequence DNA-binding factor